MSYVSVGHDERARCGEIGEGEEKGGRRTDVAVPVLIRARARVPLAVTIAQARVHSPRAGVAEQVSEEGGRVPAAREEEQEAAADVDVRRRGRPRGQQDRRVHHVRELQGMHMVWFDVVSRKGGTKGARTGTYDGPAGALERDDEGGGAPRLVALVAEPEIGVVLWDEEARDQYPADVEERSSRTYSPLSGGSN